MKIDINKKYQTKHGQGVHLSGEFDGRIYGALEHKAHGWLSHSWSLEGHSESGFLENSLIPQVRKDALGQELPEDMPDLPEGEWVWVKEVKGLRTIERGHKFESDWCAGNSVVWAERDESAQAHGGADYYIQKLHRPDGTRIDEPKGKTPEQWFEGLPEGIKERAIANIDKDYLCYEEYPLNINEAINYSFNWVGTKEGGGFWSAVDAATDEGTPYPTLPEGEDDFGNKVPAELLPLPEAPEGYKRKYEESPTEDIVLGFAAHKFNNKWTTEPEHWYGEAESNRYIRLVPEQRYWSKPSDFPPVCWVILSPHETNCFPITAINMDLKRFHCHGRKTPFSAISLVRWDDKPFDHYEDGKPCIVES